MSCLYITCIPIDVLFPVMIFNLLASAQLDVGVLTIVGYVLVMYLLAMFVVGPRTVSFTGQS